MLIATYSTRIFPYLFALAVFALIIVTAYSNLYADTDHKDAIIYLLLTFSGLWLMILVSFIKGSTVVKIYDSYLTVGNRFYTNDAIVPYEEIDTYSFPKATILSNDHTGSGSMFINNGKRLSSLLINLKNGEVIEINMNDFDERDELWKTLRKTAEEHLSKSAPKH